MSRIKPEEVREIATLARLALRDDEILRMASELDGILGYIETLKALDLKDVEPMTHAVPFACPFREDVAEPGLPIEEVLRNAPKREASFFQVPRILPGSGGDAG
jgi:aspartyl-tRNA(Asn)/glutamyl-tRNA(Gln) amidotransferase subunit C